MRAGFAALLITTAGLVLGGGAAASTRIGVAEVKADTTAFVTFRGDPLRSGDHVLVFLFSPPRIVDGAIRQASAQACNPKAALAGQAYLVRLRYAISDSDELGVAVLDPTARVEYLDGEFVVFTKGASSPLQMRLCASGEGLHLTAWRGNRRTWHEYYYLGYDLEPNCSDAEAGP